jgi:hypothetical protein
LWDLEKTLLLIGTMLLLFLLVLPLATVGHNCTDVNVGGIAYNFGPIFSSGPLLWSGFLSSINMDAVVAVNLCGQASMPDTECPTGAGVCVFAPDANETDNAGFTANTTYAALSMHKGVMATVKGQAFPAMMSYVYLICNVLVTQPMIVNVNLQPYTTYAIFSISIEAASACPMNTNT